MQHGSITDARCCPPIRRIEQRLYFCPRKRRYKPLINLLHWNGMHPKRLVQHGRYSVLEIAKEGLYGCQPCVARTGLVASRLFDVLEKGEDRGHVDVFDL
ncbi:hypothetical protein METH_22650 (plasmid) [Leisingera methylohalidivorans DSM 14336]|uniref:Uncharacterized protein n=1 Tax=Leisingera methylohalidivorans DSM 14336 TaxID=999552 RepID=V9W396_9RHOB|nr:hypothetical protein METH_22650 [Leisingera methylohalidivorans DSM 14336]